MAKMLKAYDADDFQEDGKKTREICFVRGVFSNFFKSIFIWNILLSSDGPTLGEKTFNCGEQAFHYAKAIIFGDEETAQKILNEPEPSKQKELGRTVSNFNNEVWNNVSYFIMLQIQIAKFSQPGLYDILMDTGDANIIEGAYYDKQWGNGKSPNDTFEDNKPNGKNLLGKAIMEAREIIRRKAIQV